MLPCIEGYTKVDLRTVSFDVPPQEVWIKKYARLKIQIAKGKNSKNSFNVAECMIAPSSFLDGAQDNL